MRKYCKNIFLIIGVWLLMVVLVGLITKLIFHNGFGYTGLIIAAVTTVIIFFIAKEKIANFFIVYRDGLENKWWHRLANVLIYGSTIIFLFFVFFNLITNTSDWKTYSYTYNFQPNYSQAKGNEVSCFVSSGDNFVISLSEDTFRNDNCAHDPKSFLMIYQKTTGKVNYTNLSSYDSTNIMQVMDVVIKSGDLNNLKVKKETVVLYNILARYILLVLFITFIWFIFWESIVYRSLVYIILGKEKK